MKSKCVIILLLLMLIGSLCFAFCNSDVKQVLPETASSFHTYEYYLPARR